ncbi:MAG TPA: biotin/lipoyl-binding protein, partial [Hyphomicrobium sp.]|nr:biotin/lipoyl-binding protein [Hyphomicrobium sp.]
MSSVRQRPEVQPLTAETAPKSEQSPRERAPEAPAAREKSAEASAKEAAPAKGSRRKPIFMGIGALALMAGAYFAYQYVTVGRFMVSTDDAYVGAYMSIISPKVSAIVTAVPVVDNEAVKEGQVL